jgi:poly(hydroxyalkanoate) depolymerase family esterase
MSRTLSSSLAVALSLGLLRCTNPAEGETLTSPVALTSLPNETAWADRTRWTWESGFAGLPRAWVYRPASFSKKSPQQRGVVFHLLGCGELPHQIAQGAGWAKVADAYGLVIVVPDIIAPSHPNPSAPNTACYNFGTNLAMQPTRSSPDHRALIAAGQKVVTSYPELAIDPRQVYLTGLSAGATVAMQVACMAPDVFAGVGSVAGPAIGADQSRAVMPPSIRAEDVRRKCTSYASSSPVSGARAKLATQVYALVSDDNGLPAGNPVFVGGQWTAEKFAKQTIWDGDKYVPHAYHAMIATAMASIFGAQRSASGAPTPFEGTGVGCPGGEASHDDVGETECTFTGATARAWKAKADIWTDAQGRQRIVHIEQDTLRHRWPVGAPGALDFAVTPDRAALVAGGYILPNGQFDVARVSAAPNGMLGAVFFANDSLDFPTYFAGFVNDNNPRLAVTP